MPELGKKIFFLLFSVFIILSAGTLGYSLIEKWNFLDALYMTVITLATVGYGEIHELSRAGRIFTMLLIMSGIGIMTYIFTTITSIVMEGDLKNFLRRLKMENKIFGLVNHFIICGDTHTGMSIAEELKKTNRGFVIISTRKEDINRLISKDFNVIEGDATSDEVLEKAGVKKAYGIFCALDNDRDNAFVALTARGLNPSLKIISTQNENSNSIKDKLIRSGVDVVISPYFIGGLRMVSEMVRPNVVSFLDSMLRETSKQDLRFEEIMIKDGGKFVNRTIKDLKLAIGRSVLIVAVRKKTGDKYEINPADESIIENGDAVIMLGSSREILQLYSSLL